MSQRFYSDEEADAILQEATQKLQPIGMTRDRLLATAAELGITPEAVEEAEQNVLSRRQEVALSRQFDKHARQSFLSHLAAYAIINIFLVFVDFVTTPPWGGHWFYWALMGWGIAIAFHALTTFNRNNPEYKRQFEIWSRHHRRKDMTDAELAAEIANDYLRLHPGDASGAARHVRGEMNHRRRMARREFR